MKNTKKIVALACVVALSGAVLAGCKKNDDTTPSKDKTTEQKAVTLNLWEQDDPATVDPTLKSLIADFMKANPKITVKMSHYGTEELRQNYTTAAMGSNGPDIVLGPNDNIGIFAKGNYIVPITDVLDQDYLSKFDAAAMKGVQLDGKTWMLPDRNGNELLLFYNKNLVTKAPTTWEDVQSQSKALISSGKIEYGVGVDTGEPFFSLPFLPAFGGSVFKDMNAASPTPNLNTPEVTQWMTFWKQQRADKIIPKETNADAAMALFQNNKTAFMISGPWNFGKCTTAKMNWGIMAIPSVGGKDVSPFSAQKGYTVSAKSVKDADKKQAIATFLQFMNSKDAQIKMSKAHGQLPTLTEALQDSQITSDPLIAAQAAALAKCTPQPIQAEMRFIWDAIRPVQQEVFAGKTTPDKAGAEMQKKAETGIASLK